MQTLKYNIQKEHTRKQIWKAVSYSINSLINYKMPDKSEIISKDGNATILNPGGSKSDSRMLDCKANIF